MQATTPKPSYPWLMLISRSALFLVFQALIALMLKMAGIRSAWNEAARWWTFMAILANIASIYLLVRVFNAEGKRYFEFAELPTYFGYVMPRLAAQLNNGWVAWLIASFFLAAQHMFLPLILDGRFMLWRLGMFLPFALFVALF